MMVFGYFLQPGYALIDGLIKINISPSVLISDYMEIGGPGAAYFNSGLVLFITLLIAKRAKARLSGALIAGLFTVAGFAFFGKNLINSLPLMLGVYLYTRFQGLNLANLMHIACFATGISPAVSFFMFGMGLNLYFSILLSLVAGIIIGFIITPLSTSMLNFHKGYNLYNVGFTLGIIGLGVAGILRMFNYQVDTVRYVYEGDDSIVFISTLVFFVILLIYGLYSNKGLKGYNNILSSSGQLVSDFTLENHKGLVIINMSWLGIISTLYVKVIGGQFNGPVLGGILTIVAFGAFGKHPKNVIPIILGVYLTSLINKYDFKSTEAILIALFGTTLAPISGKFGIFAGLLAGFVHKGISSNIGFVHGGMNLYNNGLAGGFTAGILIPLFELFEERKKENEQRKRQGKKNM